MPRKRPLTDDEIFVLAWDAGAQAGGILQERMAASIRLAVQLGAERERVANVQALEVQAALAWAKPRRAKVLRDAVALIQKRHP